MNTNLINENLLQYIWQFKYFNTINLVTQNNEPIEIIHQGNINTNQGPDFLNAKIKIGNTIWVGHVELHINTSDWQKHKHTNDANYKNVVLHAVWNNDKSIESTIPILELQTHIPKILLDKYQQLMLSQTFIPCQNQISSINTITWLSWKERLLAERLQRKATSVNEYLVATNNNWEEAFWWMLAKNFGVTTNADAFLSIAQHIPVSILAKHKNQIHQLEALLMGVGGLLTGVFTEDYPKMLQKEFLFLQKKYRLKIIQIPLHFLRMRPSNFPTTRLAQLAVMIQQSHHLFSKLLELKDVAAAKKLFNVTANDYWHYHYNFNQLSNYKEKKLGSSMVENIIINTFVPILFAYSLYHNNEEIKSKAIKWLEALKPEKNSITNGFVALNIDNKSAFDSQALIELKNNYCNEKRCLECAVGNKLLKNN